MSNYNIDIKDIAPYQVGENIDVANGYSPIGYGYYMQTTKEMRFFIPFIKRVSNDVTNVSLSGQIRVIGKDSQLLNNIDISTLNPTIVIRKSGIYITFIYEIVGGTYMPLILSGNPLTISFN